LCSPCDDCRLSPLSFFSHDTATSDISTLSLHDALPICKRRHRVEQPPHARRDGRGDSAREHAGESVALVLCERGRSIDATDFPEDRKSTRLNSSPCPISYAVFCLKKKTQQTHPHPPPPL